MGQDVRDTLHVFFKVMTTLVGICQFFQFDNAVDFKEAMKLLQTNLHIGGRLALKMALTCKNFVRYFSCVRLNKSPHFDSKNTK